MQIMIRPEHYMNACPDKNQGILTKGKAPVWFSKFRLAPCSTEKNISLQNKLYHQGGQVFWVFPFTEGSKEELRTICQIQMVKECHLSAAGWFLYGGWAIFIKIKISIGRICKNKNVQTGALHEWMPREKVENS